MLFLTSKVRLHCDHSVTSAPPWQPRRLFLTSKVRLHCDRYRVDAWNGALDSFPDLKGQAPLRHVEIPQEIADGKTFPDLKGQAPLRRIFPQPQRL